MCCADSPETPDFVDQGDPPPRVLIVAGIHWSVSEAPHRYDRRGGAYLLFACSTLTLRVRHYPANWRTLTDDELWDLAWTQHENDDMR